jgi:hypothetical protein
VQALRDDGVAIHIGVEPCAAAREGGSEALAGYIGSRCEFVRATLEACNRKKSRSRCSHVTYSQWRVSNSRLDLDRLQGLFAIMTPHRPQDLETELLETRGGRNLSWIILAQSIRAIKITGFITMRQALSVLKVCTPG